MMTIEAPRVVTDDASHAALLNRMRAAVLGANDGIVSVAALIMGVAGATVDSFAILVAGLAGLVAGALSMAAGEYVSVSAQRDSERVRLAETGQSVGSGGLVSAWAAAWASMAAFTAGALVPLLTMVLTPPSVRVGATAVAVVAALVITGWTSARAGGAAVWPAVLRVVAGGLLAMGVTYAIGALVGMSL